MGWALEKKLPLSDEHLKEVVFFWLLCNHALNVLYSMSDHALLLPQFQVSFSFPSKLYVFCLLQRHSMYYYYFFF